MARTRSRGAARSFNTFGLFDDHETDWLFKRTLAYMNVRCAEIGDCLVAARRIDERDLDSWISTWADLGTRVEAQARESLAGRHEVSARDGLLRAMNYYRTAEYGCSPRHPRFHELWGKSVSCMHDALPLFRSCVQTAEVPFEGRRLPGYFWRPDDTDTCRPTLIVAGGNDSSLEEMLMVGGPAAVERGFNFFTFDYPGHRGAVHLYPDCVKRPDYEVPFKAAIDHLQTLPGVDERLALAGFSFGGYVAARVAVHERRLSAVIPDSPIICFPEIGRAFWGRARRLPPIVANALFALRRRRSPLVCNLLEYAAWTNGFEWTSFADFTAKDAFASYDIRANLKEISCPTLALVGEGEGEVMVRQAREYFDGVSSKTKRLHVFSLERDGSDDHCQLDNTTRGMQVVFDWLEDLFAPRR